MPTSLNESRSDYFIGVDQSMSNVGWVVVDMDGLVAHGNIVEGSRKGMERLAHIRDKLHEVLRVYRPRYGALESGAFSASGRLFQLGGVHDIVTLAFYDHGVSFYDVAPARLKSFMTGASGAEKSWMVAAALEALPKLAGCDDNVADAAALALIARACQHSKFVTKRHAANAVVKQRKDLVDGNHNGDCRQCAHCNA